MSLLSLGLVVAGLLAGAVLLWRVRTPGPATEPRRSRSVSVVIPARDEANRLPRLLSSLHEQTDPPLEVLVVDDDSTDGTGALARAVGATVIETRPPAGWLGKPWACCAGAAAARGELLLFLDADTWLAPDGIARLAHAHDTMAADGLLSVQPFHRVERVNEELSAVCNIVPVLASGMAAPGIWRSSVAFGPCLLTRPDALRAAGGFDAVRREVVEDAALARAYRAAGRPVRCLGGGGTVAFRMYPDGIGSLAEGWTKSLAGGAQGAALLPTWGAALWVTAGLTIVAAVTRDPGPSAAAAWAAFSGQVWWMLRRLGSFHWLTAVLFPIPLLAFVGLFARSLMLRLAGRPVRWRGRRVGARR